VNLHDIRSIRFNFDQRTDGGLLLTDLAFVDPAGLYAGPFVTTLTAPVGIGPIGSGDVGFDTPINPSTFTTGEVTIVGPNGVIPVSGVAVVDGTSSSHFTVSFPTQALAGTYTVTIGPDVTDLAGHRMDQNVNGTPGENPGDLFVGTFTVSP